MTMSRLALSVMAAEVIQGNSPLVDPAGPSSLPVIAHEASGLIFRVKNRDNQQKVGEIYCKAEVSRFL